VSPDVFIAPNAAVIGSVTLGTRSSVFYGAVIRGDLNDVTIGSYTSVGDRVVIHTSKSVEGHVSAGVSIGNHVTIGAGALLQSCLIEDQAVIGAGAIIMEGAIVEKGAHVAEGAVVHPGRRIPAGQVWGGNPAVYVRDATKTEIASIEHHAEEAAETAAEHAHEFLPYTTAYQQAEKLGVTDAVSSNPYSRQACIIMFIWCALCSTSRPSMSSRRRTKRPSKRWHKPLPTPYDSGTSYPRLEVWALNLLACHQIINQTLWLHAAAWKFRRMSAGICNNLAKKHDRNKNGFRC
jgi:carbonic anhydrase/acetyltransferase-like protein (isoleucine patch superfamily)